MFHKHCSDESLIAHLDGELRFYRRAGVRRHLSKCWQCRLRLSEIESQVLAVTRAMEEDAFPGADRIAAARLSFLSQADQIAAEVFAAKRRKRAPAVPWLAWAAACAVALLGVFWAWTNTRIEHPLSAATTLQQVQQAEAQAARVPARQAFRVVARQIRPARVERQSRLEVWSEPEHGRFATRFSDSRGMLRHAVWQPEPARQYVFDAARAATVVRISRQEAKAGWENVLFRDGLTLEQLEAGLLQWLENRPWQPVSLSSGIASLAASDGTVATAERIRSGSGDPALLLRVKKASGGVTVEFAMEVSARTYAPRLQRIRYESPARSLELELLGEPAPVLTAVSFEPPQETAAAPALSTFGALPRTAAAAPDLASLEVEVHYALHRMRACMGEPIEVERRGGGLYVRGVVVDSQRKEQVLAGLAPLAGPALAVEIKSVQETLREMPASELRQDGQVSHAPGRGRTARALARFFSQNESDAEEFAGHIVSEGENLMKDAQALRYLAERFGARDEGRSPQASWLLQVMSYDHIRDLEAKTEAARQLLLPVLTASGQAPAPKTTGVPDLSRTWNAELLRLFDRSKSLNDRLRLVFVSGDDAALREVSEALTPLESALAAASARAQAAHTAAQPF